jgi:hypothetical protein
MMIPVFPFELAIFDASSTLLPTWAIEFFKTGAIPATKNILPP